MSISYIIVGLGLIILSIILSSKTWKAIYYDYKLTIYYEKYHHSFLANINEARDNQSLPQETLKWRTKFNDTLKKLSKIDPKTSWKSLN